MPIYKYRAKKGPGDVVTGNIEANSESEAIDKLSHMGYLPMKLEEMHAQVNPAEKGAPPKYAGRVRSREITIFSRQLSSLLRAGVPILSAIDIIAEQSENAAFKGILHVMHNAIKEGESLSSALSFYPRVFTPLFTAMVHSGEDSGALPEVLLRIADYRTKQEEAMARVRMALAYPILMALVGIGTIVFMLVFVMPRLMGIFINMGQNLPLPTQILIAISYGIRQWWPLLIFILALAVFLFRAQTRTRLGHLALSMAKLRLPIFGKLVLKSELARFSKTLALLIENGISILSAIDIAIPVLENDIIKNLLTESYKELEQGGSFGKSLKKTGLFPPFMCNLIIVGEESGKLSEALAEVADSYEKETDEAMKVMASLLEPLMILVMGLVVGFIVIAMLLPIFEINVMVR